MIEINVKPIEVCSEVQSITTDLLTVLTLQQSRMNSYRKGHERSKTKSMYAYLHTNELNEI